MMHGLLPLQAGAQRSVADQDETGARAALLIAAKARTKKYSSRQRAARRAQPVIGGCSPKWRGARCAELDQISAIDATANDAHARQALTRQTGGQRSKRHQRRRAPVEAAQIGSVTGCSQPMP
jgi:hypothetical protein